MKVAIIGQGAIGQYVRSQLGAHDVVEVARIVRAGKETTDPLAVSDLRNLPERSDLIIDCGGHAALAEHGPVALAMGVDVLTVSLGALADAALYDALQDAAKAGNARLHLTSGAIGGLDALRGARAGTINQVTYTGRKPPQGWAGSPAEDVLDLSTLQAAATHFKGTAREAALRYPKNANVAAAVALAGIGFDATQVELIADPSVTENIHEVHASGDFGHFRFTIAGKGLPENPRSSALAAMSVVSELVERQKRIGF
ncbi:MAG: aspartate dehydrogenase [Yoonia sp.]|uniref:aspartate dehydrogenase n=1 Tax=Yoonia sp. TaxID=2212373 RepID=UPI003EF60DA8